MEEQITRLDRSQFRDRLPESLSVYVSAMGYAPQVMRARAPSWLEHSGRAGWECVAALGAPRRRLLGSTHSPVVGVCYGYRGARGQWWSDQVARGLVARGRELVTDYVELTELHVAPDRQGHGLGRALLTDFLSRRPERRVLLSTPEVAGERNGAWRLYRSLGFTDVLRSFRFDGDPRPFAVLGRNLPLDRAPTPDRTPAPDPA